MLLTVWMQRNKFDCAGIEVYSGYAFIWAEVVCLLLGLLNKPFVLTLQGGRLPEYSRRWHSRVKRLLSQANIVITPSKYIQDYFRTMLENIQYLPNAIELSEYEFIHRTNLTPTLTWLRAFHKIYNPTMAVKMLAELTPRFPDAKLTMIGPDKKDGSLNEVIRLAKSLNVVDRVLIVQGIPKDEVSDWLNRSQIFLNTTNYDSFGVSVMEAAACGLPIITTNVGEHKYLWSCGQDALLVSQDDAHAMATAVCSILDDPQLASRLSENGRRKATRYDWSVILPQWCEIMENAMNQTNI
jgi:glycosyltransferase involved in cell wall biosynthesis